MQSILSFLHLNWQARANHSQKDGLSPDEEQSLKMGGDHDKNTLYSTTRLGQNGIFVTLMHVVRRVQG